MPAYAVPTKMLDGGIDRLMPRGARQLAGRNCRHVYSKFEVFRQFRPLALGIHESLIATLSQFDPVLISRVVANHCRKPRYIKSLARGGKRFDLSGKPVGEVKPEEKKAAELQSVVNKPNSAPVVPVAAAVETPPAEATSPESDAQASE